MINNTLFNLVKTIHIISMVCWFAGLFYLPRLFIYHVSTTNTISRNQFMIMEHKLFWYIMTPSGILTIIMGEFLAHYFKITGNWLHIKVFLVMLLCFFHVYCFKIMDDLSKDYITKTSKWLRVFNEIPTIILILCIYLVIFKPNV